MNKKTAIILSFIVILTVAGIFAMQKRQQEFKQRSVQSQNQTQQQSLDNEKQNKDIDTSDWKTHISEGWGYSIKYPSNLYIKVTPQGDRFPGDTLGDNLMPKGEIFQDGGQTLIISDIEKMGVQDIMPNEKIHVEISTRKKNSVFTKSQSLEEYLKDGNGEIFMTKVNEIDAYEMSSTTDKDKSISIFVLKNDWAYNLYGINLLNENLNSYNFKVMRKIIETFEFKK